MGRLINIGYGNMVNFDKIVSVVSPESAPIKRMIQTAKDKGTAIDATQGRKTQGVIITDCDYIILSALLPETIAGRCRGHREDGESADSEKNAETTVGRRRGCGEDE